MTPAGEHPYRGIYAATLTPFLSDGQIDEDALRAHFLSVTAEPGIVGVLCNGHAGECFLLSREERRRVTEIAAETIGATHIIVCGILAEATQEAAAQAGDAAQAGADVALVFPPFSWALSQDDSMAVTHHDTIAKASGLPLMIYQAGVSSKLAYTPEVLASLAVLPGVVGIKEGSWESNTYERNRRLVAELAPHVEVMASGDEHLLSCFVQGSTGSIVSLAAIMPADIVALDRAVQTSDLKTAIEIHRRIQPLANAIYGLAPSGHATARLKMAMELLGRWKNGAARPPITALKEEEMNMLRNALDGAGLLPAVS
ncbi:4-hydroxy-tetrahydrodipicolinate synthase [Breoghania corrubedonensis]|uniref:4-hydroxy-tetrahydrodipicolinate synthase n=1 Tax=Breoghania corrubedonensis TaxID=665038 RepID=A0A2T5VFQ0_9HYPH|nr:dihydrodipicolinate synthase family protein [Breoghania corrubedonensis]PTW62582.1 4-hydroxy-tetrahydrodipicolinate synthase [Breoghania corrubedonensis]